MSHENTSRPVALVVGGSGGIGSALARRLIEQDWHVVVAARDGARVREVAGAIGAEAVELDATRSPDVDTVVDSIVARHGRLDGVAHCVGSILLKPAHLIRDDEFAGAITSNLASAFFVVRAAVRAMMRQSAGGGIVLCSSVAARRGLVNHEAIAAAKAGVEGLALAAAASYARQGIRVNCVAPGLTRTGLTRRLTDNESLARASAVLHPLGRIGEPDEVASALAWFLDPAQRWVTGQVLGVDGGLGCIQSMNRA